MKGEIFTLTGFIAGLLVAWILSLFGVQVIITTFCLTACHFVLTASIYYVGFGLFGIIFVALKRD